MTGRDKRNPLANPSCPTSIVLCEFKAKKLIFSVTLGKSFALISFQFFFIILNACKDGYSSKEQPY